MFPDERGVLQSSLETWWLRLAEVRATTTNRHLGWMRGFASIGTLLLNKVYGPTIWSRRAFNAALLLSLSSVLVTEGVGLYAIAFLLSPDDFTDGEPLQFLRGIVQSEITRASAKVAGLFLSAAGAILASTFVVTVFATRRFWLIIARALQNLTLALLICLTLFASFSPLFSPFAVHIGGWFTIEVGSQPTSTTKYVFVTSPAVLLPLLPGWLIGALADFAVIAVFRRILTRASRSSRWRAFGLIVSSLGLLVALNILPRIPLMLAMNGVLPIPSGVVEFLAAPLSIAAESNLYVTLIPFGTLVMAVVLVVDRAVLPILVRATHDPVSLRLVHNRAVLWGAAAVLLGFAAKGAWPWQ